MSDWALKKRTKPVSPVHNVPRARYLLPPKPPGAGACPNGAGAGAPNAGVEFADCPNPPPDDPNGV